MQSFAQRTSRRYKTSGFYSRHTAGKNVKVGFGKEHSDSILVISTPPGDRAMPVALPVPALVDRKMVTTLGIPPIWQIQNGIHSGRRVPLDVSAAYGFGQHDQKLFHTPLRYWPSEAFPLNLSVRFGELHGRESCSGALPRRDEQLRLLRNDLLRVENAVGLNLFADVDGPITVEGRGPGTCSEAYGPGGEEDVLIQLIDKEALFREVVGITKMNETCILTGSDGLCALFALQKGFVNIAIETDVNGRIVWNSNAVVHELLHILGLGHTCSFRSILTPKVSADSRLYRCDGSSYVSDEEWVGPTRFDVAYFEVMQSAGEAMRTLRTPFGPKYAAMPSTVRFQ